MADNLKISQLNAAAALTGAELVEVVQDGANVKTTTGALVADKLSIADAAAITYLAAIASGAL